MFHELHILNILSKDETLIFIDYVGRISLLIRVQSWVIDIVKRYCFAPTDGSEQNDNIVDTAGRSQ